MTKLMLSLAMLFAAIIIGGIMLFQRSVTSLYQVEAETTEYVKQHADIIQVNDFYYYNGTEDTYFTVSGYNSDSVLQVVIVRQSDGAIQVFDFEDIVSEYDAYYQVKNEINPEKIMNLRIGLNEDNVPIWEISFKDENGQMGYYYMHLETGEKLETITHI